MIIIIINSSSRNTDLAHHHLRFSNDSPRTAHPPPPPRRRPPRGKRDRQDAFVPLLGPSPSPLPPPHQEFQRPSARREGAPRTMAPGRHGAETKAPQMASAVYGGSWSAGRERPLHCPPPSRAAHTLYFLPSGSALARPRSGLDQHAISPFRFFSLHPLPHLSPSLLPSFIFFSTFSPLLLSLASHFFTDIFFCTLSYVDLCSLISKVILPLLLLLISPFFFPIPSFSSHKRASTSLFSLTSRLIVLFKPLSTLLSRGLIIRSLLPRLPFFSFLSQIRKTSFIFLLFSPSHTIHPLSLLLFLLLASL